MKKLPACVPAILDVVMVLSIVALFVVQANLSSQGVGLALQQPVQADQQVMPDSMPRDDREPSFILPEGIPHYVSPNGTARGSGTVTDPWDLATALRHPANVRPGDTIWLRGGTYGNGSDIFTSLLTGTPTKPIVFRQYPGEHATIDGGLQIHGAFTWFWGFEVTSSGGSHLSDSEGPMGLSVFGPGTKLINLVLHDARSNEIGLWAPAENAEVYGNLTYYCGWYDKDGGHGHGIYTQNENGTKFISDNIIFDTFGIGIQAYGSDAAFVRGYQIAGNVIFNAGSLPYPSSRRDNIIVAGGGTSKQDITIEQNYTYYEPALATGLNRIGADWDTVNRNVVVRDNYWIGGYSTLEFWRWKDVTFTGNVVYTAGPFSLSLWQLPDPTGTTYEWNNNVYFGQANFRFNNRTLSWQDWKNDSGMDSNSALHPSAPTGVWLFVRPNKYEPGRANIIVYNWDLRNEVTVDVSKLLTSGAKYVVRDAQNFYGAPVATGVYDGSPITIPMHGLTVAPPDGEVPTPPMHTAPEFGVFVLMPE